MAKKVSKNGIDLIKEFEGCYLDAYQDSVGVWTIGYGITNSDKSVTGTTIESGLRITQETADKWLRKSLNKIYVPKVLKYDNEYNWTQNQLDALVSFVYNIGSIDQLTANGTRNIDTISAKLLEYNKAGGRVLNGLTRRRVAEKELFDKNGKSNKSSVTKSKNNSNDGNPYPEPTQNVTSNSNAKISGINNFISKGDGVKWVQWELVNSKTTTTAIKKMINNSGGVDGECGTGTVKAIAKYQRKNDLIVDGVVGKATRNKMKG